MAPSSISSAQPQPQPQPPPPSEPKRLINLLRGWPSPRLLPADLLKEAAGAVLSDPAVYVPALQYGPDPGYEPLREALGGWLGEAYGVDPDPQRICITGGASQNLACLLQSFTDPAYTRAVWAVAPCYFLACPIFEDAGFKGRLRAVPEDEEGIDLVALERGFEDVGGAERPMYKDPSPLRKIYRHVIYVVPTCANPSGKTMSLRRREALVHLARKHDALVICDDVYDFLQWPVSTHPSSSAPSPLPLALPLPPLLPRLSDIDMLLGPSDHDRAIGTHFGHAVSNGSFSKLVGPGVRTGWAAGTRALAHGLAQTGSTRSGGAPSQLVAALLTHVLVVGALRAHLEDAVRPALRRRHAAALAAVRKHLCFDYGGQGPRVQVAVRETSEGMPGGPAVYGGYFLWLTLPGWDEEGETDGAGTGQRSLPRLDAQTLAARAQAEENLIIAPGAIFEVAGDEAAVRFPGNIRLCFSWEDEDVVVEGIERLGRVLRRLYGAEGEDGGGGADEGLSTAGGVSGSTAGFK